MYENREYLGGRIPSVKDSLRLYYTRVPHGVLERLAIDKLKRMGYRIISRDDAPEWIRRVGSPDIIAERGGEHVIVEVKPSVQLWRYSKAKAKLILITNVKSGRNVEVWGLRELEE